jgi:hypothetical protein
MNALGGGSNGGGNNGATGTARAVVDALTSRQWDELTDVVLRRIERNAQVELARRGRRREGGSAWR